MRVSKPAGKILFGEVQRFRETWVWIAILVSSLLPLILVAVLGFAGKMGSKHDAAIRFVIVLFTCAIPNMLFYWTNLETVLTDEGVYYRWMPFFKRYCVITWPEVRDVMVRKYPYLNYGYHWSYRYGKVHKVGGSQGVQFILRDNKKVWLGTRRLQALQYAIEQVRPLSFSSNSC